MNPLVFVNKCDVGLGLFSTKNIKKGEHIFIFSGRVIPTSEAKHPEILAYTLQIGMDSYIDPEQELGRFINHSCQPNAGIIKNNIVVALQDIPLNTEVRFDYSTTMLERHWTMKCSCGALHCRKVIEDFDLLPSKLQRHYLEMGIVQEFIVNQLRTTNNLTVQFLQI
ncbi:MAG: hypothetical protein RIT27_1927 [Pseudomonadota bacterium]|jgi:SET domain-containing protein